MQVREEQGYTVLEMDPYIAKDAVPGICKSLDPHLEGEGKELILDMWEAKTLNSSMASVIVHIVKKLKETKSTLHIVNLAQNVTNALQTLHLADLVRTHETALDFEIEKGVEIKSIMH
ncbi:MAG: STAS domain-containing protein [Chitinivibrionales bacterium]|nr:STAS domain-containing protein [Chitinivibrionales bacterium]MBD3397105.1 STAS domain-containing protein [Chitinivibrionales bacterium]